MEENREQLRADIQSFAKQAGDSLLKGFRKGPDAGRFHGKDKKIPFDQATEILIKRLIREKYPDHSILAEETGFEEHGSDFLWIVDPLDGTGNYANCNPFFSVSIALHFRGHPVFGVVYVPFLGETFFAEESCGAFLNGKKISVSAVSNIKESFVLTCEGGERDRKRIAMLRYGVARTALDLRKIGSAAIECSLVACGRADAFYTTKIDPWDVAAGILLVKEAGGKISSFEGKAWEIKNTDLVVSNGKLHEGVIKILKECSPKNTT